MVWAVLMEQKWIFQTVTNISSEKWTGQLSKVKTEYKFNLNLRVILIKLENVLFCDPKSLIYILILLLVWILRAENKYK